MSEHLSAYTRSLTDLGQLMANVNGRKYVVLLSEGFDSSPGGELFRNWNDLSQAMGKMLDRTSVTYVISFQPEVEPNGAYHPIKVSVNPCSTRAYSPQACWVPVISYRKYSVL